jgi:hypothetical protein
VVFYFLPNFTKKYRIKNVKRFTLSQKERIRHSKYGDLKVWHVPQLSGSDGRLVEESVAVSKPFGEIGRGTWQFGQTCDKGASQSQSHQK